MRSTPTWPDAWVGRSWLQPSGEPVVVKTVRVRTFDDGMIVRVQQHVDTAKEFYPLTRGFGIASLTFQECPIERNEY